MFKTIVFVHSKFKNLEVFINQEEKVIMFEEDEIRKMLKITNNNLFPSSSYSGMMEICDLFEYIKYSKVEEGTRWEFEEWIAEIILDCAKLI